MKKILSKIRVYCTFALNEVKILLSYRLNFFMFVAGGILFTFVSYYLWRAVYQSSSTQIIEGFSITDMTVYVFMAAISSRIINSGNTDGFVADEVKSGGISMSLIKPIRYETYIFSRSLGQIGYQTLLVALPIWIVLQLVLVYRLGGSLPRIQDMAFFLCSVSLSVLIMFFMNYTYGLLSFVFTNLWGFLFLKRAIIYFLSGAMIPLSFFPDVIERVLLLLPFSSMIYTPILIYMGRMDWTELLSSLGLQLFWVGFFWLLMRLTWRSMIRRLTILGG